MGTPEDLDAVTDAGPLIHLSEIGMLSLLRVFRLVHLSESVWSETVGTGRVDAADVERVTPVQRHAADEQRLRAFAQASELAGLQRGELESLHLCRDLGVPLLLVDDLAAREAAQRLNIRPVGSLGVVVRAYRAGHVTLQQAEKAIQDLYGVSSLFVTKAIVDLAIESLRESGE